MPRHVPVSIAWIGSVLITASAFAQQPGRAQAPVTQQASMAGGHIRGVVRDDAGLAVNGVMVVAVGTTLAAVKSDVTGRYSLSLPPGEYILRAARDGYVSTYREPVRMQTSATLERNITLLRQGGPANVSLLPSAGDKEDHAHDEAAWRLRYLPRTALRDIGQGNGMTLSDAFEAASTPASILTNTGLSGQVNYLTASLLPSSTPGQSADWGRSIAFASVGAPVGDVGDWVVRGAFNAGDISSWVLHGEYRSRPSQAHMLTLGLSHSAQVLIDRSGLTTTDQSRSVGEVYGYDRWHAAPRLDLSYGMRVDRYDYLATPTLVSPQAGMRLQAANRTYAVMSLSFDRIAPGADEFLPPSVTGPWMPPQRTFSPLGGAPLSAEGVQTYAFGLDRTFGSTDHTRTLSVRRFRQDVDDQVATLFGVDIAGDSNHYYVATSGDAQIDGWSVGIGGDFSRYVTGNVTYALGQAAWTPGSGALALARVAPSAMRDGRESVHDLTTSLSTRVPSTSTDVSFVYRVSSSFTPAEAINRAPQLGGRFDLELRQMLPYQPIRGGRLDVLFAVRNLFYDAHDTRSMYDELLTAKPPLRLVGGIQIRF